MMNPLVLKKEGWAKKEIFYNISTPPYKEGEIFNEVNRSPTPSKEGMYQKTQNFT